MVMGKVEPGRKVRVAKIACGHQRVRKLYDLGIIPGAEVEVVSRHPFRGPIVLRVGNATVALGRNIASEIEVTEIT